MFSNFDFGIIIRSLPYLFYDGMTFTLTLTALATLGGIVFGTALALMRLSGLVSLSILAAGYVNLMRSVPLVLMIFWFYFLVPYLGQWLTGSFRSDNARPSLAWRLRQDPPGPGRAGRPTACTD